MKKISLLCLMLFLLQLSPLKAQTDNQEWRAAWVITWHLISGSSTVDANKARIVQILDNLQAANMNAVLWHVRQAGTAYYNSSYEPWGSYAGGSYPGFDPLEFAIEEAHKRGMELHAWFNCFAAASTAIGAPAQVHPEWVCRDQSGIAMSDDRALSPGMEAVREYMVNVAMEVVNNYDIDGLHLDYVRWNEYSNSKTSKAIAAENESIIKFDGMFRDEIIQDLENNKSGRYLYDVDHPYSSGVPQGYNSWEEYWRGSVTTFVHTLHDSIQSVKPWVRLSPAAIGKYNWSSYQGYGYLYQDAALWFNEGYIEQLTPMSYHWTTATGFTGMLVNDSDNWGKNLSKGIEAGRLFTVGPGSYVLDEQNVWDNHSSIINACRTIDWVDGFQFFSYGEWKSHQYFEEAGKTFFSQKTKTRNIINGTPPVAPTISLTKQSDLQYDLVVTPDGSTSSNSWFIVYRSEDATIDPASDEIVGIHYGMETFTMADTFDGTQNFNSQYYYGATTADRYWIESTVSNTALSDAIPSYAPMVNSSSIADGDTIPINKTFVFEFSKEIDAVSFENNFSIVPDAPIEKVTVSSDWKDAGRTYTVVFSNNLGFNTDYTVTLGSGIVDINGVGLDGNRDGVAGDALVIHVVTEQVDQTGPQIMYSNPSINEIQLGVNLYEVITIGFDELIDENSIDPTKLIITNGENSIFPDYFITSIDERSVLSIRPRSQLVPDTSATLSIGSMITDTLGNEMNEYVTISYTTDDEYNQQTVLMDDFEDLGDWWDPEGSGSTVGTLDSDTEIHVSTSIYVPGMTNYSSMQLAYQWEENATSGYLLRLHNPSIPTFDTTYTIQMYVWGDASNNQIRISCYEYGGNDDIAEVSQWTTIDWIGWRLIEWDLGDPESVGSWNGNGIMDGETYCVESIQMTHPDGATLSGAVYIDELRLVKKSTDPMPVNYKPQLTALSDTTIAQGKKVTIYPTWSDQNVDDSFMLSASSDTSAVRFIIYGHTSGSRVYISPLSTFSGSSIITIVVKDLGIGELSDTISFNLTVTPKSAIGSDELTAYQFALEQNYPNPFNPTTNIRFSIPAAGMTTLTVYNLLGNEVALLVKDNLKAGEYEFTLNGDHLASGQYFYRLQSGNRIMTRKRLSIK